MKAYAAASTAAAAARAASNYAIKMAQSASLAESKAIMARQNLEKYVFGTAVSTVPPVISPSLSAAAMKYPSYPYVSSPQQWGQGVPPIAVSSVSVNVLISASAINAPRRVGYLHKNFL